MKLLSYNPWIVGKAHTQFWLANLETARSMMQALPDEQIDLRDWRDPERGEQVDGIQYAHDAPPTQPSPALADGAPGIRASGSSA